MEMLIVVAIIAILVAISIPTFNAQLEKARENTDIANMRAAKAEAVAMYLTDNTVASGGVWIYDAENGRLVSTNTSVTGYGKGTTTDGGMSYGGYKSTASYSGKAIVVTVTAAGEISMIWS